MRLLYEQLSLLEIVGGIVNHSRGCVHVDGKFRAAFDESIEKAECRFVFGVDQRGAGNEGFFKQGSDRYVCHLGW